MVGNNALNWIDVLGLRELTTQENRILNKLKGSGSSRKVFGECCEEEILKEFGERLIAAADAIREAIEAVPEGEDDPAGLRSQLEALARMYFPTDAQKGAYGKGAKGPLYKCSQFVRSVIQDALNKKFKSSPNAGAIVNGNDDRFEEDFGIELPPRTKDRDKVKDVVVPGDIVAGGSEGQQGTNEAHVVISLPNGVVIGHHPNPPNNPLKVPEVRIPGHNITIKPLSEINKKNKVVVRVPK